MSTPQKLTKFYISETQNLVYTLKQAKNPHTATRGNLIAVDDKYATFYEYTKGADGKISLTKVAGRINYSSLDWCRLCGEPIFKEGFSFCCERHAGKHLEMANMDFEEKMYDRGIPVKSATSWTANIDGVGEMEVYLADWDGFTDEQKRLVLQHLVDKNVKLGYNKYEIERTVKAQGLPIQAKYISCVSIDGRFF